MGNCFLRFAGITDQKSIKLHLTAYIVVLSIKSEFAPSFIDIMLALKNSAATLQQPAYKCFSAKAFCYLERRVTVGYDTSKLKLRRYD